MPEIRPLFIAGPTAVGKSAVALSLARRLNGEIISVDSMQVYRGMDIGTAKPSALERAEIPHHLIDIVELSESFDAAEFIKLAKAAVCAVQSRRRVPILCGGTGLYFKAYLYGLGSAPSANEALRAELGQKALPMLLEELKQSDPAAYELIDRSNRRRVQRALEVIRLTGRPFSEQRAHWIDFRDASSREPAAGLSFFALDRDKGDLRRRIDARVDDMFRQGLVEEVQRLLSSGLAGNKTAMQALGYRQVATSLLSGMAAEETVPLIKLRTWQFAKRQMTWFRHQLRPEWVRIGATETAESVAKQLEGKYLK